MCVTAGGEAAAVVCAAGEPDAGDVDPPALAADAGPDVVDTGAGVAAVVTGAVGSVTVWVAGARCAAGRGCRRFGAGCRDPAAGASPEATLSGSEARPIRWPAI